MHIQINLDTDKPTDMQFLAQFAAISGGLPNADPQPAAADKTRGSRSQKTSDTTATASSVTSTSAPAASLSSTAVETGTSGESSATISSDPPVAVTEADLTAAANAAAAALGPSGPGKIKAHIARKFTKIDGQPGTLKSTRPEQQAALLADLQAIGRKELTL